MSSEPSRLALFDAHNHLHDAGLALHRDPIRTELIAMGVQASVVNGTAESDWPDVAALCTSEAHRTSGDPAALTLIPSFGLHPWDVGNRTPHWQSDLRRHLDAHPQAGVGEIGLDRWMIDRARPDDPRLAGLRRAPLEEQAEVFRWQLALAAERNLPASIHCLDAFGPLLDVLTSTRRPRRGFLLHAYSGSHEMAEIFADLGAYFSFNGGFLDPRKERLQEFYTHVPAERLLVETDAPAMRLPKSWERFHLPPGTDGQLVNHPANIAATYAGLAELRRITPEQLAGQIAVNFARLFHS